MANLPRISSADLPEEERAVAVALIEALGDDLAALIWQGSWARGEANPESDHDLVVIMRRLDEGLIGRIASVFRDRTVKWSTFIKTEEEIRQYPAHGRLQFLHGVQLIHGDFEPPPVTRANLLEDMRHIANEVEHETRYRLVHRDLSTRPAFETARDGRLLYYWSKVLLLALKARELLHGRKYPVTRTDLRARLSDADELALLDIIERWPELRPQYERDFTPLGLLMDRVVRKLVSELPPR
jgi:predicted nucleotidyltransferase